MKIRIDNELIDLDEVTTVSPLDVETEMYVIRLKNKTIAIDNNRFRRNIFIDLWHENIKNGE